MTFSFHPEAEAELRAAIEHYENHEAGLGYDFSLEVLAPYGIAPLTQLPGRSWRQAFGDVS